MRWGTAEQCNTIAQAYQDMMTARDNLASNSPGRAKLDRALNLLGPPDQPNGIEVKVTTQTALGDAVTTGFIHKKTTIRINLNAVSNITAMFKDTTTAAVTAGVLVHESTHGADGRARIPDNSARDEMGYELRAATAESFVFEGLHTNSPWRTWTVADGRDLARITLEAEASTYIWCTGNPLCR